MNIREALPNPTQWLRQLRPQPGEGGLETASAWFITLGSMAMTAIAAASVALTLGVGTVFAETILGYTYDVPYFGEAHVLVSLALVGGIAAVPYSLQLEQVASEREILANDANWIIAASAIVVTLSAVQEPVNFSATGRLAFALIGPVLGLLFLSNILSDRI